MRRGTCPFYRVRGARAEPAQWAFELTVAHARARVSKVMAVRRWTSTWLPLLSMSRTGSGR